LPQTDLTSLFPDAASRYVERCGGEIMCGKRIKSVEAIENYFEVVSDTGSERFDAVILAIGPHQFDSIMLPPKCAPTAPFTYEPIVTIYLKFARRVRLPTPMLGQAEGIAQWFFDRRLLATDADMRQRDDGLIAAVISASGPHETLSQEQLASGVLTELARHTGTLPPLIWHKVVTEKFATFSCVPAIQRLRPSHATGTKGVFLAGDYTSGDYPATIEGAIRSGIGAARHAATYLRES
jgi:predicted NAD/FAD-dependent oxidoreductase